MSQESNSVHYEPKMNWKQPKWKTIEHLQLLFVKYLKISGQSQKSGMVPKYKKCLPENGA